MQWLVKAFPGNTFQSPDYLSTALQTESSYDHYYFYSTTSNGG